MASQYVMRRLLICRDMTPTASSTFESRLTARNHRVARDPFRVSAPTGPKMGFLFLSSQGLLSSARLGLKIFISDSKNKPRNLIPRDGLEENSHAIPGASKAASMRERDSNPLHVGCDTAPRRAAQRVRVLVTTDSGPGETDRHPFPYERSMCCGSQELCEGSRSYSTPTTTSTATAVATRIGEHRGHTFLGTLTSRSLRSDDRLG